MPKRFLIRLAVVLVGLAAAFDTVALGFGQAPESVVFGQPLDVSIPLHIAAGESLDAKCLSAQVDIGDRRLPARAVQVQAEGLGVARQATTLRVRSFLAVEEPVVLLSVTMGCRDSVTRQFTVFADPAVLALPRAAVAAEALALAPPAAPAAPPVATTNTASAFDGTAGAATASAAGPRQAEAPRKSRAVAKRKARGSTAKAATRPTLRTARSQRAGMPVVASNSPVPRLRLEPDEPLRSSAVAPSAPQPSDIGAAVAAVAAPAAEAVAVLRENAAAAAAEARLALLERDVLQLQAAASFNLATAALLRAQLGRAESLNRWLPALLGLVLVLATLTLWQALRVRNLQRERQAGWAAALTAAQGVAEPEAAAVETDALTPVSSAPEAWPAESTVQQAPQVTAAATLARAAAMHALPLATEQDAAASLQRPASAEELIDLEQQAEFFAVLGQDESAIDLLMDHLRSTGGTSPLPYLKLLEIYRRRDDREAYERLRKRFNGRFNAVAPDWGSEPDQGRSLLDHAGVLEALQAAWPKPVDAMAELETLLFRKSNDDLFELPAYRDVLLLYAVARDLHRQADDAATRVDVLLPLGGGSSVQRAAGMDTRAAALARAMTPLDERPTAPVDLDLSEAESSRDSNFQLLMPVSASLQRTH